MFRKLFITISALALLLALTSARPLPHNARRDLSSFNDALSDRALAGLTFTRDEHLERRAKKNATARKAAGLPALPKSRKARAVARQAKGITTKPASTKKVAARPAGVSVADHARNVKAAKIQAKNDSRNANLKKLGKAPVAYANSKKALKTADRKRLQAAQHTDDAAVKALKASGGRALTPAQEQAAKAERKAHLAVAKGRHAQSLATGTFPARNAKYITAKGNVFTGKDVRQADFTAHMSAQKPVGYRSDNGNVLKKNDRHPKEFQNREQGPPRWFRGRAKPLPVLPNDGSSYREYGIVHDKAKGYDGRSPNPTEARLITKQRPDGVHEFAAVVAHPNSNGPDRNDHHVIRPQSKFMEVATSIGNACIGLLNRCTRRAPAIV